MRKLKKSVAFILCFALISSLCTFQMVASVAAEDETVPTVEITDSDLLLIEKLEAFGVISNEYDPSSYATRREMAEIIAKYIALPSSGTATTSPFGDVATDDAAIGAISGLYNMGVITGDGNGNFHPDNNVTYDEALVFIINAVGHKIFAQRSGGYPTGYHRIAIQHDMLDNLNMSSGKAEATVIDIYKMLNAALSAAMVETIYYGDGDVQYTLSTTDTFLSENYGIRKYRGKVTGNELTRLTSPVSNLSDEQIEIDNKIYDTTGYIYGYFLGYTVDYYLTDKSDGESELIYVEETPKANRTVKIDADDIKASKTTSSRIYYGVGDKEEHIDFISYVDVIYNSQSHTGYGLLKNILPDTERFSGYIEALDNNNDGVYDVLFVYEYKNMVVKSVDSYNETIVDEITGATLELGNKSSKVRILSSENGKSIPFGSISKGKVLSVAEGKAGDKVRTVYVSKDAVSGKITSNNSTYGYEINGEYYKKAPDYYGKPLAVGISGKFYLDISGKIAAYGYDQSGDNTSLAVTAGLHYESSVMKETVVLKIFTSDGKMEEHNLKSKIKIDNDSYDLSNATRREAAVRKLCNNYTENGMYKLNDSYVIRYTLDDDKNINYIDMGGSTSGVMTEGSLNILADHFSSIRVNYGKIMSMFNDTIEHGTGSSTSEPDGQCITTRLNTPAVIFVTPKAGELYDTKGYAIKASMNLNKFYTNVTYFNAGSITEGITNFSAYSFGMTDVPMIDAIVLRGSGTAGKIGDGDVALKVITDITEAVDEDGVAVPKLYQGNEALGALADTVSYTCTDGTAAVITDYSSSDLIDNGLIAAGDVIQFSKDGKGDIKVIRVVSRYDYTNEKIVPSFSANTEFIKTSVMYNNPNSNLMVGEVTGIDTESGILSFKAGTYDQIADIATAPVVLIFDTVENEVRVGNLDDIQVTDVMTMRTWSCFYAKEVIVFR